MKALVLAACLLGALASEAGYTGTWYRDDDASDDAEAKIAAAVRGLIEKTSRGKRTAEDVEPGVLKRLQRVIDTFVQYADELYLEDNGRDFVVDDGGDRLRIFYLDAKKHERQMPNGTRLETTASRIGNRIEIYQKTHRGAKIFESFTLAKSGEQMVHTVRLEDKQLLAPLAIRNVYTRAE